MSEQTSLPENAVTPSPNTFPPEIEKAVGEWRDATCLLLGATLKQLGRRAVELKPNELKRFTEKHRVEVTQLSNGNLRYEIKAKK